MESPEQGAVRRATPPEEILRFFRSRAKRVISFAGSGELGYQEEEVVERVAGEVLAEWSPKQALVNSGTLLRAGGEDGIARIYAVARASGFETAGVHPSVALDFAGTHTVSPHEEHVFFVEDASWGGFVDGRRLSPTLRTLLDVSDELVVVGGGKHAADELTAFLRQGKKVRYFAAEMNHRATWEWCAGAGAEIRDLRGEAHRVWRERRMGAE